LASLGEEGAGRPRVKGTGEGLVLERRVTDHRAKILIMEDDPALVRLLSLNLEGEGYTVNSAGDGIARFEVSL